MGRYVTEQIGRIPAEDIAESHEQKYTTALVIGRRHFVERVYHMVKDSFPEAILRTSEELVVDTLDGYRRLARNADSRLGWRIVLHTDSFAGADEGIARVLAEDAELTEILPDDYRTEHLAVAEAVRKILDDEGLTDAEVDNLQEKLGRPLDEIEAELGKDPEAEEVEPEQELNEEAPSIICTSLLGAKGLSAGYVFIVGFNDGTFPEDPDAVTDDEVCKLIVGLSRTRKECHLVSCGRFGAEWTEPSSFLGWLDVDVEERVVNRDYW
jgi:superfamily I DNA/RNA helicase